MYIRTYIEFLTMLSIGASKKNQLLSLLAEIYLYDSVVINGIGISNVLCKYVTVIDGLISGMWKYMCYDQERQQKKHPMKRLCENLSKDKKSRFLGSQINNIFEFDNDADKNEHITPLIEAVGKLIFSMVYSLWFMFKKYHISYIENGEPVDLEKKHKREFYYKELEDLRKTIDTQVQTNTMTQDMQTLRGFQSDAKKFINRYNTEINKGKRQMKKESGNITKISIKSSVVNNPIFGRNISADIHSTISAIDTKTLHGIITTIIGEAERKHTSEVAELKAKLYELQNEVMNKHPNREKVKEILDWSHKLTAISVSISNLYRFIAPFLGFPLLP
jgi:hypothetical protein